MGTHMQANGDPQSREEGNPPTNSTQHGRVWYGTYPHAIAMPRPPPPRGGGGGCCEVRTHPSLLRSAGTALLPRRSLQASLFGRSDARSNNWYSAARASTSVRQVRVHHEWRRVQGDRTRGADNNSTEGLFRTFLLPSSHLQQLQQPSIIQEGREDVPTSHEELHHHPHLSTRGPAMRRTTTQTTTQHNTTQHNTTQHNTGHAPARWRPSQLRGRCGFCTHTPPTRTPPGPRQTLAGTETSTLLLLLPQPHPLPQKRGPSRL